MLRCMSLETGKKWEHACAVTGRTCKPHSKSRKQELNQNLLSSVTHHTAMQLVNHEHKKPSVHLHLQLNKVKHKIRLWNPSSHVNGESRITNETCPPAQHWGVIWIFSAPFQVDLFYHVINKWSQVADGHFEQQIKDG